MAEAKSEVVKDIEKYEAELNEVNRQLNDLDNRRAQIVRVGVRIEGILAYLRTKLEPAPAKPVPAAEGGAEKPAEAAAQA